MPSRSCIVGAGAAGIATSCALSRNGVAFDWFEGGSAPGGLWRYNNDSGLSAVYASLLSNTSAANMRLFGFEIPGYGQGYLTHVQVAAYLEAFVDHAGLRKHLTPATWTTRIEREGAGFRVATKTRAGESREGLYDSVVIATGRNWSPAIPTIEGNFEGRVLHSIEYKTADIFAGKRVVVAGLGNTGADIAVDAAGCAAAVTLSTRTGAELAVRYRNGGPSDLGMGSALHRLPPTLRRLAGRFKRSSVDLPPKAAAVFGSGPHRAKAPVINDKIAGLIESGEIVVRPPIREARGSTITFTDGSHVDTDIIVWATGFKTSLPFFSDAMLARNENFAHRYFRVTPPGEPGLYFVGQAAVFGPVFPVLEAQARWVADLIAGKYSLPGAEKLARLARADSAANRKLLAAASRGEDTVETYPYLFALRRIHKTG